MPDDGAERVPRRSRPWNDAPKPPAERRKRRAAVEQALLIGEPRYYERIAFEFGTSIRTVRNDARAIQRLWAAEDKRLSRSRRAQALRRYQILLRMAMATGQLGEARQIQARIDKLHGLEVEQPEGGDELEIRIT
jgi:hypothetical protein